PRGLTLLPVTPSTTTQSSSLSLHDALPISWARPTPAPRIRRRWRWWHDLARLAAAPRLRAGGGRRAGSRRRGARRPEVRDGDGRSEEHTSELQSRENLVCRLLLEKKNIYTP